MVAKKLNIFSSGKHAKMHTARVTIINSWLKKGMGAVTEK